MKYGPTREQERPTSEALEGAFGDTDIVDCALKILVNGTIQLNHGTEEEYGQ